MRSCWARSSNSACPTCVLYFIFIYDLQCHAYCVFQISKDAAKKRFLASRLVMDLISNLTHQKMEIVNSVLWLRQLLLHNVDQISQDHLRSRIVAHIKEHPYTSDGGLSLSNFLNTNCDCYCKRMSCNEVFVDHITLQASCQLYDVQILVISSNSIFRPQLLRNSDKQISKSCLVFGHIEEGEDDNYVSLTPTVPDSVDVALSKFQHNSSVSFSNDYCTPTSTLPTELANDEHSEAMSCSKHKCCVLKTGAMPRA